MVSESGEPLTWQYRGSQMKKSKLQAGEGLKFIPPMLNYMLSGLCVFPHLSIRRRVDVCVAKLAPHVLILGFPRIKQYLGLLPPLNNGGGVSQVYSRLATTSIYQRAIAGKLGKQSCLESSLSTCHLSIMVHLWHL